MYPSPEDRFRHQGCSNTSGATCGDVQLAVLDGVTTVYFEMFLRHACCEGQVPFSFKPFQA